MKKALWERFDMNRSQASGNMADSTDKQIKTLQTLSNRVRWIKFSQNNLG